MRGELLGIRVALEAFFLQLDAQVGRLIERLDYREDQQRERAVLPLFLLVVQVELDVLRGRLERKLLPGGLNDTGQPGAHLVDPGRVGEIDQAQPGRVGENDREFEVRSSVTCAGVVVERGHERSPNTQASPAGMRSPRGWVGCTPSLA